MSPTAAEAPPAAPPGAAPSLARLAAPLALVAMALAGLGISVYLTTVHYAGAPLACSTTGVVDCSAVLTSQYSVVPGTSIPVTVPGLLWFAVSGGLALAAARDEVRGRQPSTRLAAAAVLWSLAALAAVLWLVFAEVARLHRICEWCTGVHLLVGAGFIVSLLRLQRIAAGAPAGRRGGLAR